MMRDERQEILHGRGIGAPMQWSILLLEDDDNLREALADYFEEEGSFEVVAVDAPANAIHWAQKSDFDLMITDVRLAGMDGIECVEQIRRLRPGLRTIVMTGYASQDVPGRAIKVEAEDYLHKPFSLRDLHQSVMRVLEARKEQELLRDVLASYLGQDTPPQSEVEQLRDRFYRSFHVGIRSGLIGESQAAHLWGRLEHLEQPSAGFGHNGEKREAYRELADSVGRPVIAGAPVTATMRCLFNNIKSGRASVEQVKFAGLIKKLDPVTLRNSPNLAGLHATTWGPA